MQHPCPVCEVKRWREDDKHLSAALVHLQVTNFVATGIIEAVVNGEYGVSKLTTEVLPRLKLWLEQVRAIQQRHGHMRE